MPYILLILDKIINNIPMKKNKRKYKRYHNLMINFAKEKTKRLLEYKGNSN